LKKQFSFISIFIVIVFPLFTESAHFTFVDTNPGSPILKNQITLSVEKSSVTVDNFFLVDTAQRTPEILYHPAGRRQYVFLYDLIFNSSEELLQARQVTEGFLSKIGKGDLVAIAGITPKDGLKFFCTLTADRNQVISGLNAIGREKISGKIEGPEGNSYSTQFSMDPAPEQLETSDGFLKNLKSYTVDEKKKQELAPVALQSLIDLGFLFSTLDGRKNIVFFSNGFDTGGLSVNLGLQDKAPPQAGSSTSNVESPQRKEYSAVTGTAVGQGPLEATLPEVASRQRPKKDGVELIVDLFQGTDGHFHIFHSGVKEHGFLKDLSEKTSGTYFHQAADPVAQIDQVLATDRNYYVIDWQPNLSSLKHLNAVNLEVSGRKISSPLKWLAPKPYVEFTPLEKKIRLASAIYTDYGKDTGAHFWTDFLLEDGVSKIVSFIQLDGAEILKNRTAEDLDSYELVDFAVNQDESITDFSTNIVELDLKNKKLVERLTKSGIKAWSVLLGNQETSTVRSVVIHTQTGEVLSRSVPVNINDSELTMSYPFFPALNFDWIVWPKPDENHTRREISVGFPYKFEQDYFFPDLSPSLKKTDVGRVFYVKFYNMLPESKNPPISLFLVDQNGESIEIQQFGLMKKPNHVGHGGMELFWKLQAIPDVTPGTYNLKVNIRDTLSNKIVSREFPVQITM
jgi:hypothetical protein